MPCCPEGSIGAYKKHEEKKEENDRTLSLLSSDEEKGKVIFLSNDLPCYVVGDENSERCIVIYTDVWGFNSGRHRVIADALSESGYFVVMPDLFRGHPPFIPGRDMEECLNQCHKYKFSELENDIINIVHPFCLDLASTNSNSRRKVCALGFCYGAYLWMCSSSRVSPPYSCCASVHPAVINICMEFKEDYRSEVKKINCPIMLINAMNDSPKQKPGGEIEKLLLSSTSSSSTENIIQNRNDNVFETIKNVRHGYFTRGEIQDENVKLATEHTFESIINFFEKHTNVATV